MEDDPLARRLPGEPLEAKFKQYAGWPLYTGPVKRLLGIPIISNFKYKKIESLIIIL